MKLDLLYEVDVPKPWPRPHPYGQREAEQQAYREALELVGTEPERAYLLGRLESVAVPAPRR